MTLTIEQKIDAPFKAGEIVRTTKGARFWGEVASVYLVPWGQGGSEHMSWRVDVRAIHPEFLGTIHVYPAVQLEHWEPSHD